MFLNTQVNLVDSNVLSAVLSICHEKWQSRVGDRPPWYRPPWYRLTEIIHQSIIQPCMDVRLTKWRIASMGLNYPRENNLYERINAIGKERRVHSFTPKCTLALEAAVLRQPSVDQGGHQDNR